MKAIYQKPNTDIITISVAQMISASNNYGSPEKGQNLDTASETTEVSGNLSRRSQWDDLEEEEEEW